MERRVDFEDTFDLEPLEVPEDVKALESQHKDFALWDILKELGRRARRKAREQGRDGSKSVRDYMRLHPEVVEEVKKKHGLT